MKPERLQRLPAVLFEIGKLIGSQLESGVLMTRIAELVCQLVEADACSVMLLNASRDRLSAKAAYGLRADLVSNLSFELGEGVAGWVCETGESALIDDVSLDPRFVRLPRQDSPIASMICVPLTARTERVGIVSATSDRLRAFTPEDIELLKFVAATIALDIENVRLHRVAVTDPLTGAYNREFLAQRLPQEIELAIERGKPLSLAMVDVDHFKSINDAHGHGVGDVVLGEIARRLRTAIRGGDLLVRYGGEEFLVVLPKADAGRAWEVGERMRQRVADGPIVTGGHSLMVQISVGVAEHRGGRQAEAAAELIHRADIAMYAAKTGGRNRVAVAP